MDDCCLTPNPAIFPAISWRDQVNFQWDDDEVRSNTISCIFIVLTYWNNTTRIDLSPPLVHIILIPSQPVLALSPLHWVISGETTNTNSIVFGLTERGSNPRSTLLEASTLTITPHKQNNQNQLYITELNNLIRGGGILNLLPKFVLSAFVTSTIWNYCAFAFLFCKN